MAASSAHLLLASAATETHRRFTFRDALTVSSLSFPRSPHHRPSLRGRASISPPASVSFKLFPPHSDPFIQWDPPPPEATSRLGAGASGQGATLVVLLGWLGAAAEASAERRVADLAAEIAAWCDADHRRTLLFHIFSNGGWLAYGTKSSFRTICLLIISICAITVLPGHCLKLKCFKS
ncbi:hypothetical protein E2562_015343 [Oryza meyeriana var. granulata]|uniref:Uncharacterized protein n=1 Tax=Oryza meyeriana var. granulata TaxID=110450 RepID=A0A6G1EKA7_9ORYZ|nr:hypothetical protein E2562_015343 [Oryza meyeriana var. granulata]